jgi:putative endonuclease
MTTTPPDKPVKPAKPHTGNLGEAFVAQWLQQHYQTHLIASQWTCRVGELDLVVKFPNGTLVFVEVKTRSRGNWDHNGLLAVSRTKQVKLIKAAQHFLLVHPHLENLPCRFDVAIVAARLTHPTHPFTLTTYIEGAFEAL